MTTLQKGARLIDRFVLLEPLAQGGVAEVWRALDERRGKQIALRIKTSARAEDGDELHRVWESWQREYALLQRVLHPGVLVCDEPVRDDGCIVLPMSLCATDARSLRGKPHTQIVPVLIELAEALANVHQQGVVHRDLKPANVLIDFAGRVRLADFEIAAVDGLVEDPRSGSPFCMSPQQRRAEPPTAADDIYGFGALAYELLSAYPPYFPTRPSADDLLVPALKPVHAAPDELIALVESCLHADPAQRPLDMTSLREALSSLSRVRQPAPLLRIEEAVQREPVAESPRSGRPLVWLGVVATAVALVGTFVILPRYAPTALEITAVTRKSAPAVPVAKQSEAEQRLQEQFNLQLGEFGRLLDELEAQGAGIWGGEAFAGAKTMAELAMDASIDRQMDLAVDRIGLAMQRLSRVATQRPATLAALIQTATRSLDEGRLEIARQSFERALLIDPDADAAVKGLQRIVALGPMLAALVEAETAQLAYENLRALTLFEQVLSVDPDNAVAKEGLARARRALGSDSYARAVGETLAAIRQGRESEARSALARARAIRPQGAELAAISAQLEAVNERTDLEEERARLADLERAENWGDALRGYEALLTKDRSLVFAREGRTRAAPRAELSRRLDALIAAPARLAAPEVRREAERLLAEAARISEEAPALRLQTEQMRGVLQSYEKPVFAVLQSDGLTRITVQRVGVFGVLTRKELQLRPGRYVVVGTREGFRDVRREINLIPAGEAVVIDVRCTELIS
jgi:tetratricopeptide (TPR) repeat protein